LAVVDMGIAAEMHEQALHDRQDEPLVLEAQPAEERLHLGEGPELLGAPFPGCCPVEVEGAPAEDPALDEIGMDVARLLERKVNLVDRAVTARPELELLLERGTEQAQDPLLRPVVERGIDAVPLEN